MNLDEYVEESDGQSPVIAIGLRIKRWRRFLGISQEEMAARTQLKRAAILRYEAGINAPGSEAIIAIAKTGVNIHWLLIGDGPMSYHAATGEGDFNQIQSEDASVQVAMLEVETVLKYRGHGQSLDEVDIDKFLSSCAKILSILGTSGRTFLLTNFGRMVIDAKLLTSPSPLKSHQA